jgi:uncharacterized membrane protein required for colicin V production
MLSLQVLIATLHGLLCRICGFLSGFLLNVKNLSFDIHCWIWQVALTEAKEHISEMNDGKEVNIYF